MTTFRNVNGADTYILRALVWVSCVFFSVQFLYAQKAVLKGTVVDVETGETLIGANVSVKGTAVGTITDIDGNFVLNVTVDEPILTVSYVGYQRTEIQAKVGKKTVIRLRPDSKQLEEVVIVGYGTQTKATVTGAISEMKSEEILQAPVGNVTNALAGRMPGLQVQQRSGLPGADDTTIRIRGIETYNSDAGGVLVLVDGVERSFSQLDPEEIETITVLKDASSTAVYGIRGANGVIIVTTKRGQKGRAKISYSGNVALQAPTRLPKLLSAYEHAMLFNEARRNDVSNPTDLFKDKELQKFQDGSDPIFYPNTDWYDLCLEDFALQTKHNVSITGGTDFVRYYVTLGYYSQKGIQKEFNEQYGYSNKDNFQRFNVRTNVDMNITKSTQLKLTLGGKNGNKNRHGSDFWKTLTKTTAIASPGVIDGKNIELEGRKAILPNAKLCGGYTTYSDSHIDVNLELSQRLDFITQGLSVRGKVAYDDNYSQKVSRTKTEPTYIPRYAIVDGEEAIVYEQKGELGELGNPKEEFEGRSRRVYAEAALSYNRKFGKHAVSGLGLFNMNKQRFHGKQYPGVPTGYLEYVGRATYNYDYKYLFEVNVGYNGSENFPENKRFGLFPAFSLGWVVTKEKFVQNLIGTKVLSYLKLRASYGEVGNDKLGNLRFMYFPSEYQSGSTVYFGEDYISYKGYKEGKLGNPDVTWERSKKQNYALEMKLFSDRLFVNFDYFSSKRDNILTKLSTVPSHTAVAASDGYNIGKTENHGFEVEAGWNDKIGKVNYWIKGNYSFARNKIIEKDEAFNLENPQLWQTGRRIGEVFGYVFDGFFNSYEEVEQAPEQFGVELKPGDVRYVDVNGDGIVNTDDRVPLRYPKFPEVNYGFSAGLSYKNFDVSVLFQGATNVSIELADNFKYPFYELGSAFKHSLDRWTPANAANAKYPRVVTNYSNPNNYYLSDLWLKDASYLRLKNVQIGYHFSGSLLQSIGVSSLRVYANAQNLFTWDKVGIVDPESYASGGMSYPQMKVYNFGINVQF